MNECLPGSPSDLVKSLLSGVAKGLSPSRNLDLADKMRREKFWTAREVLGNHPVFPEKPSGDWKRLFDFIYAWGRDFRFGVVNAPRNSLKTTILACRLIDGFIEDRSLRVLYCTNVTKNAHLFGGGVKRHLEGNEVLIQAFGRFQPDERLDSRSAWREDYFFLAGRKDNAKEPNLTLGSVGVTQVTQHFDLIIVDDPCDQENTRTSDGLRGTIEWYKSLAPLLDAKSKYGPGGCMLDIGTRWADGDVHGWLLGEVEDTATPATDYKRLVLESIKDPVWEPEKGQFKDPVILNFPEVLSRKELETKRRIQGPTQFSMQYQNQCVPPETATFRREWIRFVPPYTIPQLVTSYVLTDFASGLNENNDRTAIWAAVLDWERKAYMVELQVGRWSLDERANRTMDLAQKYDAQAIAVEEMMSNEGVLALLERLRNERHIRCKIVKIGGRSMESKVMRIESLQPRFSEGLIFFVQPAETATIGGRQIRNIGIDPTLMCMTKAGRAQGDAVEEFIRFPRALHDDIPDALSDIDKLNPKTGAYLFPSPSTHGQGVRPQSPSMVNGRVVWPGEKTQEVDQGDFWHQVAGIVRQTGPFRGYHG